MLLFFLLFFAEFFLLTMSGDLIYFILKLLLKLCVLLCISFVIQGDSKVLWYFTNVRHNLVSSDAFAKVMKITNNGLWDAELTWYSPSVIYQICPYGSKHVLGIHCFNSILPYLTVKALAIQAKFLEEFDYCTVIHCTWLHLFLLYAIHAAN